MKSRYGDIPFFPRHLLDSSAAAMKHLTRPAVGDDLLLLAVLQCDPPDPARGVLERLGLSASSLLSELEQEGTLSRSYARDGFVFNQVLGRAQGLSACLGSGEITCEAVLWALLWDPETATSTILERHGIERSTVVRELGGTGMLTPPTPLPGGPALQLGEKVWVDAAAVNSVLLLIVRRWPTSYFRHGVDGEKAWIEAEVSVPLKTIVTDALASDPQDDADH